MFLNLLLMSSSSTHLKWKDGTSFPYTSLIFRTLGCVACLLIASEVDEILSANPIPLATLQKWSLNISDISFSQTTILPSFCKDILLLFLHFFIRHEGGDGGPEPFVLSGAILSKIIGNRIFTDGYSLISLPSIFLPVFAPILTELISCHISFVHGFASSMTSQCGLKVALYIHV